VIASSASVANPDASRSPQLAALASSPMAFGSPQGEHGQHEPAEHQHDERDGEREARGRLGIQPRREARRPRGPQRRPGPGGVARRGQRRDRSGEQDGDD
jgi:hypothetical protein